MGDTGWTTLKVRGIEFVQLPNQIKVIGAISTDEHEGVQCLNSHFEGLREEVREESLATAPSDGKAMARLPRKASREELDGSIGHCAVVGYAKVPT